METTGWATVLPLSLARYELEIAFLTNSNKTKRK